MRNAGNLKRLRLQHLPVTTVSRNTLAELEEFTRHRLVSQAITKGELAMDAKEFSENIRNMRNKPAPAAVKAEENIEQKELTEKENAASVQDQEDIIRKSLAEFPTKNLESEALQESEFADYANEELAKRHAEANKPKESDEARAIKLLRKDFQTERKTNTASEQRRDLNQRVQNNDFKAFSELLKQKGLGLPAVYRTEQGRSQQEHLSTIEMARKQVSQENAKEAARRRYLNGE